MQSPQPTSTANGGIGYAVVAFTSWSALPIYLAFMRDIAPLELVGWRAVFTLPFALALVIATRHFAEVMAVLRSPRMLATLFFTACLMGFVWLVFVWAVLNEHVYATSIGYYISPLVNVAFGTVMLRERLSIRQWLAVGLAAIGVTILASGALMTLGISLMLAFGFSLYGLIRKLAPVSALSGLAVESALIMPLGFALVLYSAGSISASELGQGLDRALQIAFVGLLTAIPLYAYAEAARRIDYATLGILQFISPTVIFLAGLVLFDEPLRPAQFASFVFVWAGMILFCWDLYDRRKVTGVSRIVP